MNAVESWKVGRGLYLLDVGEMGTAAFWELVHVQQ